MARPGGTFRHFACLALVLALAGCFKSAAPLIDVAHAKYPFKTMSFKDEEGQVAVLKRQGDVYHLIEERSPLAVPHVPTPLLLYEIAENSYIMQEASESGEATYIFVRRDGDKAIVRPVCRGIGPGILQTLNIESREEGQSFVFDCYVKDLNALIGLAQFPTIWSDETKTLQILSIE